MTRRHLHPIRPPATLLSDAELLDVLLQLLARTGRLELHEMAQAVAEAEACKLRPSMPIALRLAYAARPSGAA